LRCYRKCIYGKFLKTKNYRILRTCDPSHTHVHTYATVNWKLGKWIQLSAGHQWDAAGLRPVLKPTAKTKKQTYASKTITSIAIGRQCTEYHSS